MWRRVVQSLPLLADFHVELGVFVFAESREAAVLEVGDDERGRAELRRAGGDGVAGQRVVDAGDQAEFAVFEVVGVVGQLEERFEVESPLPRCQSLGLGLRGRW